MVKRREIPIKDKVEAFASGADQDERHVKINPNAPRNFKAIRVPFNEYEYRKLEELASKTGRTKLNAIRWAILKMSAESS